MNKNIFKEIWPLFPFQTVFTLSQWHLQTKQETQQTLITSISTMSWCTRTFSLILDLWISPCCIATARRSIWNCKMCFWRTRGLFISHRQTLKKERMPHFSSLVMPYVKKLQILINTKMFTLNLHFSDYLSKTIRPRGLRLSDEQSELSTVRDVQGRFRGCALPNISARLSQRCTQVPSTGIFQLWWLQLGRVRALRTSGEWGFELDSAQQVYSVLRASFKLQVWKW